MDVSDPVTQSARANLILAKFLATSGDVPDCENADVLD
jgi:hypothetical protein